ncbi:hypothetical protein [Bifidobacterium choerinum]|uniref:hypothetical protein n=1 Tax=Bifidobacterium choerinum TaxID=35760 RepID=UPI003F9090BF
MSCAICGCDASNGAPACAGCGREFNARLLWLGRVGMPALQAVAYRQVQLDRGVDRVVRTTAASRPPVDETALEAYRDAERWLQRLGGLIGLKPVGCDRDGQPVSVHDWAWLVPHLVGWSGRIHKLRDVADRYADLTGMCERIESLIEPVQERRLVGVCPRCLPDERTPILAPADAQYAVCPAFGAFLTLRDVRAAYLTAAGVLHITRTQGGAAEWIRRNLNVHVTGRDLMNARQQGRIRPRHIDGRYWEWDLTDLLAVAGHKQAREEQSQP